MGSIFPPWSSASLTSTDTSPALAVAGDGSAPRSYKTRPAPDPTIRPRPASDPVRHPTRSQRGNDRGVLEYAPRFGAQTRKRDRRANEVRARRAQLKRDLTARQVSIAALLHHPPTHLETAKVFDIVLALPKVGRVKATKILHSCRVSPSKTFGGLSERQRAELAARLHRY